MKNVKERDERDETDGGDDAQSVQALHARLAEAEATLDAIRGGLVDAVVVGEGDRQRVYTLESADLPYRYFLEHMGEGAVSLDATGTVRYCNRFFAELVGHSQSDVSGAAFSDFLAPHAIEPLRVVLDATAETTRVASELVDAERRRIPVQLTLTATGRDDHARLNVVVTDLSERENIRELRAARESAEAESLAKDRFLAAVGHDLRTPLHVVVGWTAMLRDRIEASDTIVSKALDAIERNIRLQTKLLDDILDVSRHASGKLRIERSVVDLSDLVPSAVGSLAVTAGTNGIDMTVEAEPHLRVFGDATRLEQILHNLVGNALKFTPRGGSVHVSLRAHADTRVRIAVRDDGAGIEPEQLDRVFEPFRQSSTQRKRDGGLGLGLAITKSLVELHDGRVWAHSEGPGKGSTFWVELPRMSGEDRDEATPITEDELPATSRLRGMRILVVDDEPDSRDVTARILRREGAELVTAPDAATALARLEEEGFDVVVSDLMMPGTGGLDLVRMLVERQDAGFLRLALTSLESPETRARAEAAGFHAYLTKPVDVDALCRVIHEHLDLG